MISGKGLKVFVLSIAVLVLVVIFLFIVLGLFIVFLPIVIAMVALGFLISLVRGRKEPIKKKNLWDATFKVKR
jgi:5-bromo-4-chloroindolyl phosphate hydrolysis protein